MRGAKTGFVLWAASLAACGGRAATTTDESADLSASKGGSSNASDASDAMDAGTDGTTSPEQCFANVELNACASAAWEADEGDPCAMTVPAPASETVPLEQVAVLFCDGGKLVSTYNVRTPGACQQGAWYFIAERPTTRFRLCAATCALLDEPGVSAVLVVGCRTAPPVE